MLNGSGEALTRATPERAFAYLADPRHAPEWFAGVAFAEQPQGEPREGQTWVFQQTQSGGRIVPIRMTAYEPPARFTWTSARRWPADNLSWEMRCEPANDSTAGDTSPPTRLCMTIQQRPGPLGWVSLLLAYPRVRKALVTQAQRAVERAATVLDRAPDAPGTGASRPLGGGGHRDSSSRRRSEGTTKRSRRGR